MKECNEKVEYEDNKPPEHCAGRSELKCGFSEENHGTC